MEVKLFLLVSSDNYEDLQRAHDRTTREINEWVGGRKIVSLKQTSSNYSDPTDPDEPEQRIQITITVVVE